MADVGESERRVYSDRALRRHSARVALACAVLAAALPALVLAALVSTGPAALFAGATGTVPSPPPGNGRLAAAALVSLAPVLVLALALLSARRCFLAFARGAWFGQEAAAGLASFGARIAGASALGLVVPTAAGLLLTLHLPAGERLLAVSVGSGPVLGLLVGAMIYLVADVQRRAAALAADHAQIV